jgi:putative RecB family exonuclease
MIYKKVILMLGLVLINCSLSQAANLPKISWGSYSELSEVVHSLISYNYGEEALGLIENKGIHIGLVNLDETFSSSIVNDNEIIVLMRNSGWCGSGGCSLDIYKKDLNEKYVRVLQGQTINLETPIVLGNKYTNGVLDIFIYEKMYKKAGGFKVELVLFRWNGKYYQNRELSLTAGGEKDKLLYLILGFGTLMVLLFLTIWRKLLLRKQIAIKNNPATKMTNINNNSIFSFTKLNLFEKCPMAYKFKYIEKREEAFSTIEQHMGKCIHKALEYAYENKCNGSSPPLGSIVEIFDKVWHAGDLGSIKVVKSNKKAENYYSEGIKLLDSFYSHVLRFDKSATIELEKNFKIVLDSNNIYRGIIDRVSKSEGNVLRITDFKTGKRVGDPSTDKQLQSYALWAFDTFEDNEIEVCFEDIRNLKTKIAKISSDKVSTIRKNLLKDIGWVLKEKQFDSNPSVLCGWCGYNRICDDAQHFKPGNYSGKSSWNNKQNDTGDECPRCGSDLTERYGRYGSFIGCTDYPDCRYTRNDW